jgi:hypothetical protein
MATDDGSQVRALGQECAGPPWSCGASSEGLASCEVLRAHRLPVGSPGRRAPPLAARLCQPNAGRWPVAARPD